MHTPSHRAPRGRSWLIGLLVLGSFVALVTHAQARLDREIAGLPEAERRALLERTLETLRGPCTHASGPTLATYCREQADFVRRFPGCDGECRALAGRFSSRPVR